MAKTSLQLKKILDEKFSQPEWHKSFDREKDRYRIEWKDTHEGVFISLPNVIAKYESRGEAAIDELVYHVTESLHMMREKQQLIGNEQKIFPVIRSTSFPTEKKDGKALVYTEHTAETRIYYALDMNNTYQLIDQEMIDQAGWTNSHVYEVALFNLRSLPISPKQEQVAGNDFFFIATNDGYDASRILNEMWLEKMEQEAKGELVLAVPHQDVLIVVDIQNEMGYDILAQMTMKFFAEGRVPITSLALTYKDKNLEPIFILAKNKPTNDKKKEDE
ncbi:uncharacterized protein YtpQ (UPF0354 family) [Natronobacillus azotifigens]|uniref:DUF1444 domain-containing protein n=1 Tax=Natronobacillus azotifigens TaxID=472978 RepID=A0A9J6RD15_9BACI|nr:DUF1444 domain-containing protein [Natronobacillus azotifigens]MCZ0703243.1 DUF1444 domain-containing protein [Natronobacillus azotifigens]